MTTSDLTWIATHGIGPHGYQFSAPLYAAANKAGAGIAPSGWIEALYWPVLADFCSVIDHDRPPADQTLALRLFRSRLAAVVGSEGDRFRPRIRQRIVEKIDEATLGWTRRARLAFVGHSLGSVQILDALDSLILEGRGEWLDIEAVILMGSPFLCWAARRTRGKDYRVPEAHQGILNLIDPLDPIACYLGAWSGGRIHDREVRNLAPWQGIVRRLVPHAGLAIDFCAHVGYWDSPAVAAIVAKIAREAAARPSAAPVTAFQPRLTGQTKPGPCGDSTLDQIVDPGASGAMPGRA